MSGVRVPHRPPVVNPSRNDVCVTCRWSAVRLFPRTQVKFLQVCEQCEMRQPFVSRRRRADSDSFETGYSIRFAIRRGLPFAAAPRLLQRRRKLLQLIAEIPDFATELSVLHPQAGTLGFQFLKSRIHDAAQLAAQSPINARSIPTGPGKRVPPEKSGRLALVRFQKAQIHQKAPNCGAIRRSMRYHQLALIHCAVPT
jgi:hypothetical protein